MMWWTRYSILLGGGNSTTTLISFTIDGVAYQAEEGMTWRDWCSSEYNTDGYMADPDVGYIYTDDLSQIVGTGATRPVDSMDEISNGMSYVLTYGMDDT